MYRFHTLLLLTALTPLVAAASESEPDYEPVQLMLPRGEPSAGRTAFIRLHCTSCHQVQGDNRLPAPVASDLGPDLGGVEPVDPGQIASSIVAPAHVVDDEFKSRIEAEQSPMWDFSETMTLRQLIDVVAYLRTAGEEAQDSSP